MARDDRRLEAGRVSADGSRRGIRQPIALGDDVMTVLMGTLPEDELARRAFGFDALVVMKTGRNLGKVRRALQAAGRLNEAWLIERGGPTGSGRGWSTR